MRRFALQNKEARDILERLIEELFVEFDMDEEKIYGIINSVMHASYLEEGLTETAE
jgi:hypothetical protein